MWMQAIFSRQDLEEIAVRFSPMKVVLGGCGSLLLDAPRDVSLVPEEGIALTCDATLRWPLLRVDVPVSMHALLVHIVPTIEPRAEGATLVFRLQIDHAGVAALPARFDADP